jgi:branched-chain amino acid transport system permease protein
MAVARIGTRMPYFLQQVLNGFHSGAIYALLAFGYVLANGVLKRTNLAHGPLFAFAGQMLILFAVFGWHVLWLTLPATIALGIVGALGYSVFAGMLLSRGVFLPLSRAAPNAIVVATLGAGIVLSELARVAADTRDFWLPPMLAAPLTFHSSGEFLVTLTVIQVANCMAAALAVSIGALLLSRSSWGRCWRAVGDDPAAAAMCGVDVARIFHVAVLGSASYAAIAGILATLYYGNIGFGTGLVYGLKVLFVTAVGGYRDPLRAAAGAAGFGIAESLWSSYFPLEWRDGWMFVFLVVLLLLSRQGDRHRGHI